MKSTLKRLISLYPKSWRNRYKNEFEALLDDVPPTWRTLIDVLGGALKMQMKIWSPWKTVAAFGVIGMAAALAFSLTIPDRYVSQAVIKAAPGHSTEEAAGTVLSRATLTRIIQEADLYKDARAKEPLEDIVERLRTTDIVIRPAASGDAFAVSVAAPDAGQAQRATQLLAADFLDANSGTLVDPASLPIHPVGPRRSRNILMGLVAGVLFGSLFALFNGLKVWKAAAALGLAGAVAGAAVAYVLPDRYDSTAVLWYLAPDKGAAGAGARARTLIEAATSDVSLRAIVQRFNLYSNEPGAERKLREHLRIQPVPQAPAFTIQFEYSDKYTAQKVVGDMVGVILKEAIGLGQVRVPRATPPEDRMTLELRDPPSLPLGPYFPNRPMVTGTGFFVGLAAAVMLGIWRYYRALSARVA